MPPLLAEVSGRVDLALTTPAACLHGQRPRRAIALLAEEQRSEQLGHENRFSRAAAGRAIEARLVALIQRAPDASGDRERVFQQATRELLLAQMGSAPDDQPVPELGPRTMRHLARCVQLCELAELPSLTDANLTLLETLEEQTTRSPT